MMESSQQNLDEIVSELQVIKCVVVGDTGVGKTRLICSRAFGTKYLLSQLVQTHVPTVWAIDQYRKNPQALQRSWCNVDNVSVSLRLWDTFGDHNKDRRFAYGRADVILVCFSVVQPRSLQHVYNHWYPEILRLCPRVPIVLCGCQVDMRYLYKDPMFLDMDKGLFFKEILDDDILLPEAGRLVAQQIGAHYYETSVLEQYGIDFLFTNVIRAALVYKRECHFWNNFGILKGINLPTFQPPHLPPPRLQPEVIVPDTQWNDSVIDELLRSEAFCDVVFLVQKVPIYAHKVCLVAACSIFDILFLQQDDDFGETNVALSVETLCDTTDLRSFAGTPSFDGKNRQEHILPGSKIFKITKPAFDPKTSNITGDCSMTVVTVDSTISPSAFHSVLTFLYTGQLATGERQLDDVYHASLCLGLVNLANCIDNIRNKEEFFNQEIFANFHTQRCDKLTNMIIPKGLLSDVEFNLDDGRMKAHRVLLSSRCDVMGNMFSSNFMEASAKVISYPGITSETFKALQTFLYTGDCCDLTGMNRMELIEIANRLCLPRLVALAEQSIVRELMAAEKSCQNISEEVLTYLEPAQLHNAAQLANWCLWYLSVNYLEVYKRYSKLLHTLQPENQICVTSNRHPPVWYLKEQEVYEKSVIDVQREKAIRRHYSRQSSEMNVCGCLCFSGRRN